LRQRRRRVKISELVAELERIKAANGDLPVYIQRESTNMLVDEVEVWEGNPLNTGGNATWYTVDRVILFTQGEDEIIDVPTEEVEEAAGEMKEDLAALGIDTAVIKDATEAPLINTFGMDSAHMAKLLERLRGVDT
jgi:hypothetical protein